MGHYRELVALLRSLPPRSQLVWGDDCEIVDGVHPDSVDVHVPALSERLELNWPWTVASTAAEARDDGTTLALTCDAVVVLGRRPGRIAGVEQHALKLDDPDLVAKLAALRREIAAKGLRVNQCGGWTTEAITQALRAWCAHHADRGDLRFRFDSNTYSTFADVLFDASKRRDH